MNASNIFNSLIKTNKISSSQAEILLRDFETLKVTPEQQRLIASILAKTHPSLYLAYKHRFHLSIPDRLDIKNIALQALLQLPQPSIEDILELMLPLLPHELTQRMQSLNICHAIKQQLAICLAQRSPKLLVTTIQHFGIKDEKVRQSLLWQVVRATNPHFPYETLDAWEIHDQKTLEALAMFFAQQRAPQLAEHIACFRLTNPHARCQVALSIAKYAPQDVLNHLEIFQLTHFPPLLRILTYLQSYCHDLCTTTANSHFGWMCEQYRYLCQRHLVSLPEHTVEDLEARLCDTEQRELFEACVVSIIEARQPLYAPLALDILSHKEMQAHIKKLRTKHLHFTMLFMIHRLYTDACSPHYPKIQATLLQYDPTFDHSDPLQDLVHQMCDKLSKQKDLAKVHRIMKTMLFIFREASFSITEAWQFLAILNAAGSFSKAQKHKKKEDAEPHLVPISRRQGFAKMLQISSLLETLIVLGKQSELYPLLIHHTSTENVLQQLEYFVLQGAKEVLELPSTSDFELNFKERILKLPHHEDLFVYVLKLKAAQEIETLDLLKRFVMLLMQQDAYPLARYCPKNSAHLTHLASLYPDIYAAWQTNSTLPLTQVPLLTPHDTYQTFNILSILQNSICHHHHLTQEQVPALWAYLTDPTQYTARVAQLSKQQDTSALQQTLIDLQLSCIELAQTSQLSLEAYITALEHILDILKHLQGLTNSLPWHQFYLDLTGLLQGIRTSQQHILSYKNWVAINTDDVWTFFRAPTEVGESCQSVHSDASFNKCLLAYPMDGKNRLLAILDPTGKIKARAILRLLLDADGRPTLFMEKIYPSVIKPEWQQALLHMAQTCAQTLGTPLWTADMGHNSLPCHLFSKGSPAPFEYVDAAQDMFSQGVFSFDVPIVSKT